MKITGSKKALCAFKRVLNVFVLKAQITTGLGELAPGAGKRQPHAADSALQQPALSFPVATQKE